MTAHERKVLFITGAARGTGRATAVRAARDGYDVIAFDICGPVETAHGYPPATPEDFAETVSGVKEAGQDILPVVADVRDPRSVQQAVDDGLERFGRLDLVVAAAGILNGSRRTWEFSQDQWQTMLDVNLTGVWHTVRSTVPVLLKQGQGGSIVVINSVSGLKGTPFLGSYNAAKHGVTGLTRTLANELGEYGIRVNSIHPSGVDTPMGTSDVGVDLINQHAETLGPLYMTSLPSALVAPEQVASLVMWLASEDGACMTGAHVPIDLGRTNR